MGAYASLLTTAEHPEVSRGLVLVNGAGKFEEIKATVEGLAEAGVSLTAQDPLSRRYTVLAMSSNLKWYLTFKSF